MATDPYCYPGSTVLINKLGIRDQAALDLAERRLVACRIDEGAPAGGFDLAHLCAIHHHLFQDLYEWAGKLRTVELAKGGSQFQLRRFIESGLADVHRRLVQTNFLRDLDADEFATASGQALGDVNYVHPFREGNGRTQLLFLEQLAEQAGHPLDLTRLDPHRWLAASKASHVADYRLMVAEIRQCIG